MGSPASRVPRARSSAFPVGQRVRIVATDQEDCRFLVGRTGTVVSAISRRRLYGRTGRQWYGQLVSIDDFGHEVRGPDDWVFNFYPRPSNLEPIDDYDGGKAGSWDECIWSPPRVVGRGAP